MNSMNETTYGLEIRLEGIVQGVGFRPFVVQLAQRFGIKGWAWNTTRGVTIHCFGEKTAIDAFLKTLRKSPPPLARIDLCETQEITSQDVPKKFSILPSRAASTKEALVSPDIAICEACKRECLDITDRRYAYPFINCTHCGPRWSILKTTPYDRQNTSMHAFQMCSACRKEYEDISDRRFHAQPISCHDCGPSLELVNSEGWVAARVTPGSHAATDTQRLLKIAAEYLKDGLILAIKGLGGFHLAVNAHSFEAVQRLRERKKRPHKPLAVMVRDLLVAKRLCHVSSWEESLLTGRIQPIVCLKKRSPFSLPENLADGLNELGVMLPYTPLHLLLFEALNSIDALVMTSGNATDSPICTDNADAMTRLQGIADYFLLHDREILSRVDDSVCRANGNRIQILRRSRGYVPDYIRIDTPAGSMLACGAELKNTFCIAKEGKAFLSPHIGDLNSLENLQFFETTVSHMKGLFSVEPEQVVCDLHPDYLSTQYAKGTGLPLIQVQHHHAHAAAVMAEHHLLQEVIAIVLDGTGLGPDGTIWGGEILLCTPTHYKRMAHLPYLHMPGGDMAVKEPWRMGLSALYGIYGKNALEFLPSHFNQLSRERTGLVLQMLESSTNIPMTSSCGRLFDAVAALLGVRLISTYEGQAAMELEALAENASINLETAAIQGYSIKIGKERYNDCLSFSYTAAIQGILDDLCTGTSKTDIAMRFHAWLVHAIMQLIEKLRSHIEDRPVVLSGGSMQNRILLTHLMAGIEKMGLNAYTGEAVPVNDGGLSLGQLFIAAHSKTQNMQEG